MFFQKFLVLFTADLVADHGNRFKSDFRGQLVNMLGSIYAAASRLYNNDEFVDSRSSCSPKMLDACFHVHYHHFIPCQHNVGYQCS